MFAALLLHLAPVLADANFIPAGSDAVFIPPTTLTLVRPSHDEKDVPLDTRLWLDEENATLQSLYATPREPRLFGPGDEPLALAEPTRISAVGGVLLVYTPSAPLAPNTRHELRICDSDECNLLAAFTTGDAPDTTPPAPPSITQLTLDLDNDDVIFTADVGERDILMIGEPGGDPDEPLSSRTLFTAFSRPDEFALAADDLGDRTALRFATYDLSGNFSGWTATTQIAGLDEGCNSRDRRDREPFSCRAAAPSPWLLAIPLLLRRRRKP